KIAMQERLNKFMEQHHKRQATLPSVKFSGDNERLQHIDAIGQLPVGAQIKRVIDLLLETRKALTPETINEACNVDISSNKVVFESLKNNPKVNYDGKCFSYKRKHDLKGKEELLSLIRKFPDGIAVMDVKDAYPTIMEDLKALKAADQIWILTNMDSKEDIAYPNNLKVMMTVDDDLKQMFRGIELPKDMVDIEKELQMAGMKPATNSTQRCATAQVLSKNTQPKPRKRRQLNRRTKLTNVHLPELFQDISAFRF
ncbi:Transcription initiation factor IIE beta subunit protein, partial [Dioscorea alata]